MIISKGPADIQLITAYDNVKQQYTLSSSLSTILTHSGVQTG